MIQKMSTLLPYPTFRCTCKYRVGLDKVHVYRRFVTGTVHVHVCVCVCYMTCMVCVCYMTCMGVRVYPFNGWCLHLVCQ